MVDTFTYGQIEIRGSLNKFPDFFKWTLLLIVHTWNSSPLRSNLLRLQCTCCTVPTTSGRPHGSVSVSVTFVTASFISSIVSELREEAKVTGSNVWTRGRLMNCLDANLGQIVCDKVWVVDWCIVLVEMPLTRFEQCWPLPKESLPELP